MKKLITGIVALAMLIGIGVLWAQQEERMFIHSGHQVHEFVTADVDSIVPILGETPDLDVIYIYKDGQRYGAFSISEIDSIIFHRAGHTEFLFVVDLSEITWEDSYVYNIMAGNEVIGQLANEFLHKHLPEAAEPVVRRRTVVAYPMWLGTIDMQNGLAIDNGNVVSWNLRATLPHEMLTYTAGETVTEPPTTIYVIWSSDETPRVTTVNNPNIPRVQATVSPYTVHDQRTGPANNWEETSEDFTYGIVKIGTQFWMRENLRTTRWIDGTPIPTSFSTVAADNEWVDALIPGVVLSIRGHSGGSQVVFVDANHPSDSARNIRDRYGVLFNWFAMTRVPHATLGTAIPQEQIVDNISPEGWTVPLRAQFADLVRYVYNLPTVATGSGVVSNPILGATGGRLSGYTVEAYPEPAPPNTVEANANRASNISGFTAIGNQSRSNTAGGFNGNTMFLMLDGYIFRPAQTTLLNQHWMQFFQVTTNSSDNAIGHAPAFPANQSAHRSKFVRPIRDQVCGHNIVFYAVVPPTCTEQGFNLYRCTRCAFDEQRAPFVPPLGHDFVFSERIYPTCTEDGFDLYVCSRCDEFEERNVVPALGHDYTGTPATCTAPQLCPRCSAVLAEALGHDWGSIQTEEEPTCSETGLGYRTCSRCSEIYTGIELSQLTPQNVRSEGSMLMWDPVTLATGYIVEIDNVEQDVVVENEFDLSPILAEGNSSFDVRVRPVGEEAFFTTDCWSDAYAYFAPTYIFVINITDLEWTYSYVYEIVANGDVIGHLAFEFLHKHLPGQADPVVRRRAVVAYTMLDNGRSNLSTGLVISNGNFVSWNTNATGATPAHEILISYGPGEDLDQDVEYLFLLEGSPRMTTIEISGLTEVQATLRPMMLRDERTGAEINGETTEVEYYGVVKIGIQYWTRENLRTTRWPDGTPIPFAANAAGWDGNATPLAAVSWRNVPTIDGTTGNWVGWNPNATDDLTVERRARYGVIYNFHAVTRTEATLGEELTNLTDAISPDGWSVPMMDQVAMLINYVYNVSGSANNLPATTGDRDYIPGTVAIPEADRGRLSGYTWDAYPDGTRAWRPNNISGFTWLGAHSPSNTGGNNGTSRIMIMDGYLFVPTADLIHNQHVNILPTLRTNEAVHWHNPTWRRVNTLWGDRVRLLKD